MARHDQENLPLTNERNDRVHRAAKQYAKFRDVRMAANETEKEAHDKLMEVMDAEGLDSYSYGDIDVMVSKTRKAKVVIGGDKSKAEEEEE